MRKNVMSQGTNSEGNPEFRVWARAEQYRV
jgi:hypothetical protein